MPKRYALFLGKGETLLYSYFFSGAAADFASYTNATTSDNQSDYVLGTNAVHFEGDGLGAGAEQVLGATAGSGVIYPPNGIIRAKFKDIAKTSAARWVRLAMGNITQGGNCSVDVTNVATGDFSGSWTGSSITSIANGWTQFEGNFTTSGPDFTGILRIYLADANNDQTIINTSTGNDLGVHEVTISQT